MIEFIDYEKRLTCEEHIVLLYYSLMYKKKHEKLVERKKEDLDKFRVD